MAGLDFSTEELLEQAQGNQTAIWHLAVRWARQNGSVDDWAKFVGEDFAPSWDEMGDQASALDVARGAGLNIATTADMKAVDLTGDERHAVLTVDGPEQEWLDTMGTTLEELDRTNLLVFSAIAQRRGLTFDQERDGTTFRMIFTR